MDNLTFKSHLANQYLAGIKMFRQAVELCPRDLYTAGVHPRTFARVAYHCAFYTLYYLNANETAKAGMVDVSNEMTMLWDNPPVEPLPDQAELLAYIDRISAQVNTLVDALDLDADYCGFPWYAKTSKLEHQLVNLRHLQGHVGQLSELLMAHGIDVKWVASG